MPWKKMLTYLSGSIEDMLLKRIDYLIEENRVLLNQISGRIKLTDAERKILAEKGKALGDMLADTVTIVQPETLLKWHRQLVAKKFDGSKNKKENGRPKTQEDIEQLVIKIAKENPTWGYDRIAGAIANLGHIISDTTIGNILKRNGIGPTKDRKRNTTWNQFIKQHKDILWATDFFTTEVWSKSGLNTFYVLFFIHIQTRNVVLGGITPSPNDQWMKQVAKNITGWDGELKNANYLIHDRDTKYTKSFDQILKSATIESVILPPKSPNLNAFAERFVRSIKEECLDKLILFSEKSLRYVVKEYLSHYHAERCHQGIGNVIPIPDPAFEENPGPIQKSERIGGLLNFYHRKSA